MNEHTWRNTNHTVARWLSHLASTGYTLADIEQHVEDNAENHDTDHPNNRQDDEPYDDESPEPPKRSRRCQA
jgi:hypothetical protein